MENHERCKNLNEEVHIFFPFDDRKGYGLYLDTCVKGLSNKMNQAHSRLPQHTNRITHALTGKAIKGTKLGIH